MATQENVEAQVQQAVNAVLETGEHTEGGECWAPSLRLTIVFD